MVMHVYGSKNPKSIIVLLHGYGSNGEDLIGLAPELARVLPDTLFLSPDAPFPCEVGFGFQWFSLQNWSPLSLLAGAEKAAPPINQMIDQALSDYNLPASKCALLGFSQGSMMSLYTAPRRKESLAGVLGYSGALVGGESLIQNPHIQKPPIHLVHGDMDMVVPVAAYYHASESLKMAGFTVSGSVQKGLVHSINQAGIDEGAAFLQRVFS
jgi:phospholipase/carboxylesterase